MTTSREKPMKQPLKEMMPRKVMRLLIVHWDVDSKESVQGVVEGESLVEDLEALVLTKEKQSGQLVMQRRNPIQLILVTKPKTVLLLNWERTSESVVEGGVEDVGEEEEDPEEGEGGVEGDEEKFLLPPQPHLKVRNLNDFIDAS
jgi:hypothetical protein